VYIDLYVCIIIIFIIISVPIFEKRRAYLYQDSGTISCVILLLAENSKLTGVAVLTKFDIHIRRNRSFTRELGRLSPSQEHSETNCVFPPDGGCNDID
jgi:hypothetical protein